MIITKDSVLAWKKQLDEQRLNTIGNLNAIVGAMQDCEHWLAILEQPEPAPAVETPVEVVAETPVS